MNTKTLSLLIVMVLCASILIASIGLYAASEPSDADKQKCQEYCLQKYRTNYKLYTACYDGCIFGSNL